MTQCATCGYNNLALLELHTGKPSFHCFMNPLMFISELSQCSILLALVDKLKQVQSYQKQLTFLYSLTHKRSSRVVCGR